MAGARLRRRLSRASRDLPEARSAAARLSLAARDGQGRAHAERSVRRPPRRAYRIGRSRYELDPARALRGEDPRANIAIGAGGDVHGLMREIGSGWQYR